MYQHYTFDMKFFKRIIWTLNFFEQFYVDPFCIKNNQNFYTPIHHPPSHKVNVRWTSNLRKTFQANFHFRKYHLIPNKLPVFK